MGEHLPDPWVSLIGWKRWREAHRLLTEGRRELAKGHELHERLGAAVARCTKCHAVIFRLREDAGFALMHLTWSGQPELEPPKTTVLPSFIALESVVDLHDH